MKRFLRGLRRLGDEDGQAYLEFVIGIPILFMLLFLMLDFLAIGHSVAQVTQAAYTNSRENTNAGRGLSGSPPVVYTARFNREALGLPSNARLSRVTAGWEESKTPLGTFANQQWLVTTATLNYRPIVMGMFYNYDFQSLDVRGWDYQLNQ